MKTEIKNFNDTEKYSHSYAKEARALLRSELKSPERDDAGKIYNRLAEILRHNAVSDKSYAFSKILNLFIAKLEDEAQEEKASPRFAWLPSDTQESFMMRLSELYQNGMRRFFGNDEDPIETELLLFALSGIEENEKRESLSEAISRLILKSNTAFDFFEVYNKQSFGINVKIVREVVELLAPYRFRYSGKEEFIGELFELLLNSGVKQEAGQYFTPLPIARYIISSLPIKEMIEQRVRRGERDPLPSVIDFACGAGHFLTEYMKATQKILENEINARDVDPSFAKKLSGYKKEHRFDWCGDHVYGIDADYRLVKAAKVSAFLIGDSDISVIRANGLDSFEKSTDYKGKLKFYSGENGRDNGQFDILIANPPYSVNGFKPTVPNGKESFSMFDRFTDKSSEIECLFVERAKQLLSPGGIAAIILPSTLLTNSGAHTYAREIILKYFKTVAITEFGEKTFMATSSTTVTLFLIRRPDSDSESVNRGIDNFFKTKKDGCVLGADGAFKKYVQYIYPEITFPEYVKFIFGDNAEKMERCEIFSSFKKSFFERADIKRYSESEEIRKLSPEDARGRLDSLCLDAFILTERERMKYFFLTYDTPIVITKAKDRASEKEMLGYEFKHRRGFEGIKIINDGGMLYNPEKGLDPDKLCYYVYSAFLGESPSVSDVLSETVREASLSDLLDLSSPCFDKVININKQRSISIRSKYGSLPLYEIASFKDGLWTGVGKRRISVPVYRNTNFKRSRLTLDDTDIASVEADLEKTAERTLEYGDILLEKSGGTPNQPVGRVRFFDGVSEEKYSFSNFLSRIRVTADMIEPRYLFVILNEFYNRSGTLPLQFGVRLLNLKMQEYKRIRIPIPPLEVQKKIADGVFSLYEKENELCKESSRELIDKYLL